MVQSNFERTLRKFAHRRPFRPFVVELTSGKQFLVEHPEALAYYNGLAVYLATDDDIMYFDHHTVARVGGNGASSGPKAKRPV